MTRTGKFRRRSAPPPLAMADDARSTSRKSPHHDRPIERRREGRFPDHPFSVLPLRVQSGTVFPAILSFLLACRPQETAVISSEKIKV